MFREYYIFNEKFEIDQNPFQRFTENFIEIAIKSVLLKLRRVPRK